MKLYQELYGFYFLLIVLSIILVMLLVVFFFRKFQDKRKNAEVNLIGMHSALEETSTLEKTTTEEKELMDEESFWNLITSSILIVAMDDFTSFMHLPRSFLSVSSSMLLFAPMIFIIMLISTASLNINLAILSSESRMVELNILSKVSDMYFALFSLFR